MHHPTYLFQTPSGVTDEKINRKGQAKICDDFTFRVQYTSKRDRHERYDVMAFEPWSKRLLQQVEAASESVFNAIWLNHYRDGTVTIQWHTDGDDGLGPNAIIGSLSLGSARTFGFKSKRPWTAPSRSQAGPSSIAPRIIHINFPLFHGSLLVMGRNSQTHWLHAVPAMEGVRRERTNLTFRFYARKDLMVSSEEGDDETDKNVEETDTQRDHGPFRIRLVPAPEWGGICDSVRAVLVDAPRSRSVLVGDFVRSIGEAVMPAGASLFRLGLPQGDSPPRTLAEGDSVLEVLAGRGRGRHTELVYSPVERRAGSSAPARARTGGDRDTPLASSSACWPEDLRRELQAIPAGPYRPPAGGSALVQVAAGGDWVREVLTCLSGIQRKSRGRGQLSRMVYHQSSEFVALYVGFAKSSVHLIVTPTRLLRRRDVGLAEAPLVRRMSCYAEHLAQGLRESRPRLRFAAGLRVRRGVVEQFHSHLLSLDLVAPHGDLDRRHFAELTAGPAGFLPLEDLASTLASGRPMPEAGALDAAGTLACHRCGHLFGDAFAQLCSHISRCEASPRSASHEALAEVKALWRREVEQLEEMGFGACGRDALLAALVAEGNVERVVAALAAQ